MGLTSEDRDRKAAAKVGPGWRMLRTLSVEEHAGAKWPPRHQPEQLTAESHMEGWEDGAGAPNHVIPASRFGPVKKPEELLAVNVSAWT